LETIVFFIILFFAGAGAVALGLRLGMWLAKVRTQSSNIYVPPSLRPFLNCIDQCSEKYGFGTDEYYACVEECARLSRVKSGGSE
jgi:hypothetical protein